jgi:hypothetical protein
MIIALEHHAVLAGHAGDHERAAALVGFADAHYAKGDTRQRTELHGYERLMRLLSQAYAREELAERMNAGGRLRAEQALEHAAAISNHAPQTLAVNAAEQGVIS